MTEFDWPAATKPQPMLDLVCGKVSDRKLRLFACACCRRLWSLMSDKHSRKALAIAEQYASAELSADKLRFAWGDARRAARVAYRQERGTAEASAMWAVSLACEADINRAVTAVGLAARCEAYPGEQSRLEDARREQTFLLRDIVKNPFRHAAAVDPAWLACNGGAVCRLAEAAYQVRELPSGHLSPARLALVADALEDAGCGDAEILGHLRSAGPHVRGCWAVDRLTERA